MTPEVGARVRFVSVKGVSSKEMAACLHSVGTVVRTRSEGGKTRICVRFGPTMASPTYWLNEGEHKPVD